MSSETSLSPKELAGMIDHTFLKNFGSVKHVEKLCREARQYEFAIVAIHPSQVKRCSNLLKGSNVKVGACIGFPLGQTTTAVKAFETREAIENGATEIDMVMNIFELQNENYDFVHNDIAAVVHVCREANEHIVVKVILETCFLTDEQKVKACQICMAAGADFCKTSTGFRPSGATVKDIRLMRETVGESMGVKASGGVRDLNKVKALVAAGATRIGTSGGVAIIKEATGEYDVSRKEGGHRDEEDAY
jgi:deoxyribose-phosphate aldolase